MDEGYDAAYRLIRFLYNRSNEENTQLRARVKGQDQTLFDCQKSLNILQRENPHLKEIIVQLKEELHNVWEMREKEGDEYTAQMEKRVQYYQQDYAQWTKSVENLEKNHEKELVAAHNEGRKEGETQAQKEWEEYVKGLETRIESMEGEAMEIMARELKVEREFRMLQNNFLKQSNDAADLEHKIKSIELKQTRMQTKAIENLTEARAREARLQLRVSSLETENKELEDAVHEWTMSDQNVETRAKKLAVRWTDESVKSSIDAAIAGERSFAKKALNEAVATEARRLSGEWNAWAKGIEEEAANKTDELNNEVHKEKTRADNAQTQIDQYQQSDKQLRDALKAAQQSEAKAQTDLNAALKREQAANAAKKPNTVYQLGQTSKPAGNIVADETRMKCLVRESLDATELFNELASRDRDPNEAGRLALSHLQDTNQVLRKLYSTMDMNSSITSSQVMDMVKDATIDEEDVGDFGLVDPMEWPVFSGQLRKAFYTLDKVRRMVKGRNTADRVDREAILKVLTTPRDSNLPKDEPSGGNDAVREDALMDGYE